jgi:hypothetical protein
MTESQDGPIGLLRDGGSLGSSRSGTVIESRVLSDGVGSSVVLSLSAEHALLGTVGVDVGGVDIGGATGVGSGVLLSVGVVDSVGGLRVLSGLKLESGKVLSGEQEEVDEQEDGLG